MQSFSDRQAGISRGREKSESMEHATRTNDSSAAMRPETLRELTVLVYHPRHASDPDRPLRFARAFLAMPGLAHATLAALSQDDGERLVAALRIEFPDRSTAIVKSVTDELLGRPM